MKVSEFRNDLSNQFDAALRGEPVMVKRGDTTFQLIVAKTKTKYADVKLTVNAKLPQIPVLPGQITVDQAIESMEQVAPAEEWMDTSKSESQGERLCCSKSKPCQHWVWDGNIQAHVNTLSGRTREVES